MEFSDVRGGDPARDDGYILEMEAIHKSFGTLEVLHGIDLRLKRGEVLALMGENGAGKSTLIKILAGNFPLSSGSIRFDGEMLGPESPIERLKRGISVIYQELNYYDDLSVAENIFVGRYPRKGPLKQIDVKRMNESAKEYLDIVGLDVKPSTLCNKLSVAQKQLLEIGKAISRNAKVVVMDEPTSALNDTEVQKLFSIIRSLKEKGVSVIYISHKLDEIFVVCDRVQTLRDGNFIAVTPINEIQRAQIVEQMVGRRVDELFKRNRQIPGDIILEGKSITTFDGITDASLHVCKGEIVTIYGLMGAGRSKLLKTFFGLNKLKDGELLIKGESVVLNSPKEAMEHNIAYVPSERKTEGVTLVHSIKHNVSLPSLKSFNHGYWLDFAKENEISRNIMTNFRIKATDDNVLLSMLSGGNQQKVVLGKWLYRNPEIMIVNEPTKGIDVGAKMEVYKLLDKMCQDGVGILMFTSELPEVLSLSDRIYVLHEGRIVGELNHNEATQAKLMHFAIGGDCGGSGEQYGS